MNYLLDGWKDTRRIFCACVFIGHPVLLVIMILSQASFDEYELNAKVNKKLISNDVPSNTFFTCKSALYLYLYLSKPSWNTGHPYKLTSKRVVIREVSQADLRIWVPILLFI